MTDNLKPCPFCGSSEFTEMVERKTGIRHLYCDSCNASISGPFPSSKSIIKAWNRRAEA